MPDSRPFFDSSAVRWREVTGEVFSKVHHVRHDYTILARDAAAGTLDMLIRWRDDGGHCPLHRHTAATTSVLVLEGEQHVQDILPDRSLGPVTVRRAGEYALLPDDGLAHVEGGGAGEVLVEGTIDFLVADFDANATG